MIAHVANSHGLAQIIYESPEAQPTFGKTLLQLSLGKTGCRRDDLDVRDPMAK